MTPPRSRWIPTVLLASLGGLAAGCNSADNPKIAEAPPPAIEPSKEPPKIPGRKDAYGSNDRYRKAMERLNNPGR